MPIHEPPAMPARHLYAVPSAPPAPPLTGWEPPESEVDDPTSDCGDPWCCPPRAARRPHPLQDLADLVGGLDALARLDCEPLPDEPFAWTDVPGELVPLLEDLVPALDAFADQWLTPEFRTAQRRFVAVLARRNPTPLRRKGTVAQRAAGVAWAVLRSNDQLGPGRRRMSATTLAALWGVGEAGARGRTMLEAAVGRDRRTPASSLGNSAILVAQRRRAILDQRDRR